MTLRCLIIGDSHCAALRLAHRETPHLWPGLTIDFAARHGAVADFAIQDGHLTGRTKVACDNLERLCGRTSFDLAAYDVVALCSGTASTFHAIQVYRDARWIGLPSVDARRGGAANGPWSLVSTGCFADALTNLIRSAGAHDLLAAIADVSSAQRIAIPVPALSHEVLISEGIRFRGFQLARINGDTEALAAMLNRVDAAAQAGLAAVLTVPDRLRLDHFFTHPDYRIGAKRLSVNDDFAQPKADYLHANAEYGRAILTELARMVAAKPA